MGTMILFHPQTDFKLAHPDKYTEWIMDVVESCGKRIGELNYIFCTDEALLEMNQTFLDHDYYTDILTFPLDTNGSVSADIFISLDRVRENAREWNVGFDEELRRVMIHGVLHLLGWDDRTPEEEREMRRKEEEAIEMFHVKHNPDVC